MDGYRIQLIKKLGKRSIPFLGGAKNVDIKEWRAIAKHSTSLSNFKKIADLDIGSKIEVPVLSAYQSRFGEKIVFKIADKNHSGYPSNSVTLITEKIIQNMTYDAKEPNNSDTDRKNYGNNRYIYSNILQWMNSNAAEGEWYNEKHSADEPPTNENVWKNYNEYDDWAGFLAMLDPKFVAELVETTHTVLKCYTDGEDYETITSKMFLASATEVGFKINPNLKEGTILSLFSNNDSRVAYPTEECVSNADGYSNSDFSTSKGWFWWLRSPYYPSSYNAQNVKPDGSLNIFSVCWKQQGIRPLCNISSSILVSDATNSDGNYEII